MLPSASLLPMSQLISQLDCLTMAKTRLLVMLAPTLCSLCTRTGCLPCTKPVLQVLHGAQAAQPASCHDADARAERLALLHAVGCQNDCVPCSIKQCSQSCA